MKATGIVRRIDDLGRVVIPKEIRRTMRIREGDPLEIYTDREGEVIFKKYSPISELGNFAAEYANALHKTCNLSVVITDRDSVIACAGIPRKDYCEKRLSDDIEAILETRSPYFHTDGERRLPILNDGGSYYASCVMPILAEGDLSGAVISLAIPGGKRPDPELEAGLVQTAAAFLGKQLES